MNTKDGVRLGKARVITMRELSQRTAQVMGEINDEGRPAVITRHGRFVGVIVPLERQKVESFLLENLDEILGLESFNDEETEVAAVSGVAAAIEVGVSPEEILKDLPGGTTAD